ncbi:hypothetical protein L6164_024113 [Bauhinia variegata]|uniref:Uncharacterized protein n=1 Tax=Bauhinia variegata TaxID=167791 RepID=A0ACB9LWU9_BAUVA|nr:hypothetical protein L6164_024113 [Bauhinia variegata]
MTCAFAEDPSALSTSQLMTLPTLPDAVAGASLRERFRQLFFGGGTGWTRAIIEIEDGTMCPVCLEEMGKEDRVVACGTCRNPIHEQCLVKWKRSRVRRSVTCVLCRAKWRTEQDKYLNLSAYVSEDDANDPPPSPPCTAN